MKLKPREKGNAWLTDAGIDWHLEGANTTARHTARYSLPPDSGRKMALARLLIDNVFKEREVGLMIQERGIWTSSESEFLFLKYRQAISQAGSIDDYPFHLAQPGESQEMLGVCVLSLYFFWGVDILDADGAVFVRTSHDEVFDISFRDPAALIEFKKTGEYLEST